MRRLAKLTDGLMNHADEPKRRTQLVDVRIYFADGRLKNEDVQNL